LAATRAPRPRRAACGLDHRPIQLLRHPQHLGEGDEVAGRPELGRRLWVRPQQRLVVLHGAVADGDDWLEGQGEAPARDGLAQPARAGADAGDEAGQPAFDEARRFHRLLPAAREGVQGVPQRARPLHGRQPVLAGPEG